MGDLRVPRWLVGLLILSVLVGGIALSLARPLSLGGEMEEGRFEYISAAAFSAFSMALDIGAGIATFTTFALLTFALPWLWWYRTVAQVETEIEVLDARYKHLEVTLNAMRAESPA